MAENSIDTTAEACATVSKPRFSSRPTIQELCKGVNKDKFEFWGDRYLRFLEFYEKFKPKWKHRLWGNLPTVCDFAFLLMKDYPTIAKAVGSSIIFHMNNDNMMTAQMNLGNLLGQQQENEQQIQRVTPQPTYLQ